MMPRLEYAAVTPARNEAENLARLAASMAAQTLPPSAWVIVDDGSTDETPAIAETLARSHEWVHVLRLPGQSTIVRGGPVVRAFSAGLARLGDLPDVVVKLDADVSLPDDYFDRLMRAFEEDDRLGMASGNACEFEANAWVRRHMTDGSLWGATRAYRRECLEAVLPLEQRMGWDGIDALRANLAGWTTQTIPDLDFRHHRREGDRDGSRRRAWAAQGNASYFMGYRLSYLLLRSLHAAVREPAAVAMIGGYVAAAARREPRCSDPEVREFLRRRQRIRALPARAREARGRAAA